MKTFLLTFKYNIVIICVAYENHTQKHCPHIQNGGQTNLNTTF